MHKRIKKNIYIIAISILFCIISIYFGMSIWSANNNFHIQHLNEVDKIYHYDVALVPTLTYRAAIITAPFILILTVLNFLVLRETNRRKVKNLIKGAISALVVIIVFDIITIFNPYEFEFGTWGYIWITMGLIVIWANVLSLLIKEN